MIIQRYIYAATLVASFIFYLLYSPWFSWYLFVLILLLLPLDLLVSLPGMRSKGLMLSVPTVLEKDEDASVILTTTQTKSYPVGSIIAALQVAGDDFSFLASYKCPTEKDKQKTIKIDTSQSGVITFELTGLSVVSLLGIFSFPVKVGHRQSVLILPPPIKPKNTMTLQHGAHLRPKPGGGFSEEHDMRQYRQGDPVRSIHWKVSAKYDSLVIREPLEPPPHSRLVHIMRWKTPVERDIILGCLRWVSRYMLKKQLPYYLKFADNANVVEITQESDMTDFLLGIYNNSNIPARFSWVFRIDARSASL